MLAIVLAAAAITSSPAEQSVAQAAHALSAGRLIQARAMIAAAVERGVEGPPIERLLADLAATSGHHPEALARYRVLLAKDPGDPMLAEQAGLAALRVGERELAIELLTRATKNKGASWRSWNALGIIADLARDWDGADDAYSIASRHAPDRAEIYNNMAWSKMLRGDWAEGLALVSRAVQLDPNSPLIANNLELARTAQAEELPRRERGERHQQWAVRLNDAGVVAHLRGDHPKAVAAFSQAIEAHEMWYRRAANNLRLSKGAP